MIDFEKLEARSNEMRDEFQNAKPFHVLVIDNFCDGAKIGELLQELPDPETEKLNQSRDYVFAKNKFEKSSFASYGPRLSELYDDLVSDRMRDFLRVITGEPVFVDPAFHGGGIHQGGPGSFLDMHADFNYHPVQKDWFRNLNILIYLNDGWQAEYGGQLKLQRKGTEDKIEVEPLLNRCVIMETRDFTLHGYDPISFPEGRYRRSIAAYAYEMDAEHTRGSSRSTTWYPNEGGPLKKVLGRTWPHLVAVKTKFFGSATARNK